MLKRLIFSLAFVSLPLLFSCGGGGGSSSNSNPPPPPAPSISSFTANPTAVLAGNAVTLTAVFVNGSGSIDQGIGAVQSGVGVSTGALASTKTFTLTVTGSGTPATAQVTVTVTTPPPSITSFTANPTSITVGQGSTLTPVFANGTGVVTPGNTTVASGVGLVVAPTSTTTYTLTVTGSGTPATAQATVTVGPASKTVTGTATYDYVPATLSGLNFAGSTEKPIRNAVVAAYEGSTIRQTATTDDLGHYSITFTPTGSGQLAIAVYSQTNSPSITVQDNTSSGATWGMIGNINPGDTTRNLRATHGWNGTAYNASTRLAGPFAILDSMYTASRAFIAARPAVNFPALKVNWSPNNVPQSGSVTAGQIGTSHYTSSNNQIYILGKDGVDTDENDAHVIVHEWGHFFEANLSRSDSPGGPHSSGDILDPRLSFGEGYGNGLSGILLYPDTLYVDTLWGSGTQRGFGFDVDVEPSPTDDPHPGVFSETSIMRVLFHVFHTGRVGGAWDNVGVGLGPIYDVLTGAQKNTDALTTIGSFVTGLKAQGVSATALNSLLAHYGIGPITTQWGDGDAGLKGMFVTVGSFPYTSNLVLTGGYDSNKWQQNQYYVFTGNGNQVTVTTTSAKDVDIAVYKSGTVVGYANGDSGNEQVAIPATQNGAKYVVVITGYSGTSADYPVTVNFTTP